MSGRVYVGLSGWSYSGWRHGFYAGVPQSRWLEHYAGVFDAVELNGTFYRLPERRTFEAWRERTPDGFTFAIKGNRYVTHLKRLHEVDDSIALERERASGLGPKLAVVVWQMPSNFHKDAGLLRQFAAGLQAWPEARHALEFRHTSWFDDETAEVLAEARLAACISDAASWPMWLRVTTDLAYVRLHGHDDTYHSAYSAAELEDWADRVRAWSAEGRDVHVYFDNTDAGAAPDDARRLKALLAR